MCQLFYKEKNEKSIRTSFLFVFVLSLLFASFGAAKAAIGDDPVVTPVSGDMEFTTEVVPIASLPGTIELADLMLAPAGFPEGEAQFEGAGVMISGMDSGKATACFAVSGTQWGWGGKVGVWDGTKWVLLPTTITKAEEALNSLACASVAGNGTYAFIKYVTDPSLLYICSTGWSLGTDTDGEGPYFYVSMDNLPDGTPATLTFINADPIGNYYGFDGEDYALVGNLYPTDADFFDSNFATDGTVLVTLRVSAGGCSAILQINVNATPN